MLDVRILKQEVWIERIRIKMRIFGVNIDGSPSTGLGTTVEYRKRAAIISQRREQE